MPEWLRKELERGGRTTKRRIIDPATGQPTIIKEVANEVSGLISAISLLSAHDPSVARAWLCHPAVKHVGKQIAREGGFCGYRNIQMLISYIQTAYPAGTHPFRDRIPTILQLQDWIEEGWDKGINAIGRSETGGIRGTRKYIGTSEVCIVIIPLAITALPFFFPPRLTLPSRPTPSSYPSASPAAAAPSASKTACKHSCNSSNSSKPTFRRHPPPALPLPPHPPKSCTPTSRPSTSSTAGTP